MSRTKKTILILISIAAISLCIFCCLYIYQYFRGSQIRAQITELAVAPQLTPVKNEEEATASPTPEVQTPAEDSGIVIDIDFDSLTQVNEEIYAWLEIPGTSVSQPILQSQTDDLFYNNHNVDKSYFTGGAVYTQRYNTLTFDDAMTLIYGHNFHDQSIFAPLLNFIDVNFFRENRTFYIYTPDTVYEYEIFAAYPHTSEHLLLCYDFDDESQFNSYFDGLSDAVINANYDREAFPEFGDKVVTLSTCYRLSRGQRYLVQGVLTNTYPVSKEAP